MAGWKTQEGSADDIMGSIVSVEYDNVPSLEYHTQYHTAAFTETIPLKMLVATNQAFSGTNHTRHMSM